MYEFTNSPPPDPRGNSLNLLRTPTGRPITGIVTSDDLVGTATHFYHGRTMPCDKGNCEPCHKGLPWAWHGYISLFARKSHTQCLFEMTAKAVDPLKTYRLAHGTLRGCMLHARRVNSAPNARVVIETSVADLQSITLPEAPNILEALSIIWRIELPAITIEGTAKDLPWASVSQDRALQRLDPDSPHPLNVSGNGSKPDREGTP